MALRDLAGGAARMSAGFWKEVANALDTTPRTPVQEAPATDRSQAETSEPPVIPEGGMLVPIDTWTRILDQLGNLHQAGQDLAEARERAARAETEATFLREQLSRERSKNSAPKKAPKSREEPADPADSSRGTRTLTSARSSLASARQRWRRSRPA